MEVKSNLKDEVGDYIEPWRDQEKWENIIGFDIWTIWESKFE